MNTVAICITALLLAGMYLVNRDKSVRIQKIMRKFNRNSVDSVEFYNEQTKREQMQLDPQSN